MAGSVALSFDPRVEHDLDTDDECPLQDALMGGGGFDVGPVEQKNIQALENKFRQELDESSVATKVEEANMENTDDMDDYESGLKVSHASGFIDLKSFCGKKLLRDMSAEDKDKYKKCKSHSAKAKFRLEYGGKELDNMKQSKVKGMRMSEEDKEDGTWMALDRVWKEEGGTTGAWHRMVNYATACSKMGPDWMSWNSMTKGVEVNYIKRSKISTFNRYWQLHQENYSDSKTKETIAPPSAETPLKVLPKAGGKRALSGGSSADTTKGAAAKRAKQKLVDDAAKEAMKSQASFERVTTLYNTIDSNVKSSDSSWSWISDVKHYKTMGEVYNELMTDRTTEFQHFILYDFPKFKATYADSLLQTLREIPKINEAIAKLALAVSRVQNLHDV
jgi:hypothetical protein